MSLCNEVADLILQSRKEIEKKSKESSEETNLPTGGSVISI
jgi:hypothetical protein